MSTSFKKLQLKQYPKTPGRPTAEDRYWSTFKNPILLKEYAAVNTIDISPVPPYDIAIQIFDSHTNQVKGTISRFKDVAYSATFRSDGRLIVAGGEHPIIKLFEVESRTQLRSFKGHTAPIRVTKFAPDKVRVLSGSNDKTVRSWDIATGEQLACLQGHEDYVRCAAVSAAMPDVWATGAYDHKVKLWDTRTNQTVNTLDHGYPVESVVVFPGGSILASAGGNKIKIWDLLGGGKCIYTLSNHQKTIMTLCLDAEGSRLLSGGVDHFVKIYDVKDYTVTHSFSYSDSVLSVALSADNTHLVVGMSDGTLSIRTRSIQMQEVAQQKQKQQQLKGGSYRYFLRGKNSQASKEDYIVEVERKAKLKEYEKFLKQFQYKRALDASLQTTRPVIVVSMIEELMRRDGLTIALSGRNEETLQPIITFLTQYITNPRYSSMLIDVSNILLDLYSKVLGQSVVIDDMLRKLSKKIHEEIAIQKQMFELIGSLDLLMTASTVRAEGTDVQQPSIKNTGTSSSSTLNTMED